MSDEKRNAWLGKEENKRRYNKQRKEWAEKNADKMAAKARRKVCSRYGLSSSDYEKMLADQGGKCAICGGPPTGNGKPRKNLVIDHCHKTGKVRGLLCNPCNASLAPMENKPGWANAAMAYLEKHK